MNLIDENEEIEQAENKKKIFKIILIVIIVLVVIAAILLIYSTIKNKNTLKLSIDGKSVDISSDLFLMNDSDDILVENDEIYISVKKLASTLGGIDYNNDEYKNKGEDKTKCYIKTSTASNEYTSYISNSNELYKTVVVEEISDSSSNSSSTNKSSSSTETTETYTEYEYFELKNAVRYVNGEIYASQEAIELGFNVNVGYDASSKTVTIYTLDYLEQIASNTVATAVTGEDCPYSSKKLLKYGLVLVQNTDGDYGIADFYNYQEGDYIVSCKYSNIRFCESSATIIVTTSEDEQQGILSIDLVNRENAETIVAPEYQLIRQLYEESNLYIIKKNNKYGIICIDGNDITEFLECEYQQIGVDDADLYNDMTNKYVINDEYIPVKLNGYWGIITLDGEVKIKPNKYIGIGCNLGEDASGDGVIILTDLKGWADNHKDIITIGDGIVFVSEVDEEENKTYQIIYVDTGEQYGYDATEVYSKYENDDTNYYEKILDGNVKINLYNDLFKTSNSNTSDNTNTNNVVNTTNSTASDETTNTTHNNTSSD